MLTLEQINSYLETRIGTKIINCEFHRKTYPMRPDSRADASWRDHLLRIFSIRLEIAKENKVAPDLIKEMQSFVTALEMLDRKSDLYIWKASTKSGHFIGWATEERIISCFPYTDTKTEDIFSN